MKGIRFYLEYESPEKKRRPYEHTGNVIAVNWENGRQALSATGGNYEAIVPLFPHENSAVCGGAVDPDYLRERCRFISEHRARKIHPRLFEYLDDDLK